MVHPRTEYIREWSRNNREKIAGYRRSTSENFRKKNGIGIVTAWYRKNPERALWRSAKDRAKKRGLPFNIDVTDIVIPETCPILGVPLVVGKGMHQHSPSLDRVVNELGYIKGNVAVISTAANALKSSLTVQQLYSLLAYMGAPRGNV